jgi:hypothetical protein
MAREIHVSFVDARSGALVGETKLESTALPESFHAETTLTLGETEWSVVSAEPATRAAYESSGVLVVRLHPIERIDPRKILFSLPTINDELPASDGPPVDGSELVLQEDDWRQCELVVADLRAGIEKELSAIRGIHASERAGVGFRKLHVRTEITTPLPFAKISRADVRALAGDGSEHRVCFRGMARCISDGFAVQRGDSVWLYGVTAGIGVKVLGVYPGFGDTHADIAAFAAPRGLLLVDWCGARTL